MTGPPDKFQVVKQHNASFSQNLRAITAHQHFNVGTLVTLHACVISQLGVKEETKFELNPKGQILPTISEGETMNMIEIVQSRCNRDGICLEACPHDLLDTDFLGYPRLSEGNWPLCIECGHCVSVCPNGAFKHSNVQSEDAKYSDEVFPWSSDALAMFLKCRRSVRKFTDQSVPQELIQQVLEVTRWAPSLRNAHFVNWLIIRDPSEMKRLAKLATESLALENNVDLEHPLFPELYERIPYRILRCAPHLVIAHAAKLYNFAESNCAIALTYFELAAYSYGLGTCWASIFMRAAGKYPPLIQALGIPSNHQVFGALIFGYPKWQHHRIPQRPHVRVRWR